MFTHQKKILTVLVTLALVSIGAGCARGTSTIPSSALKQPAPAKAPVAQPQIPQEAANIPKPY